MQTSAENAIGCPVDFSVANIVVVNYVVAVVEVVAVWMAALIGCFSRL